MGKELRDRQRLNFFDLDEEIEKREGVTVGEIFANHGEARFRQVEAEVLRSILLEEDDFLMATGGGAPCFHDNMTVINSNGVSVFLDVSPETLVKRLQSKGLEERPLLNDSTDGDLLEKISRIRSKRLPVYLKSALVITNDNITSKDLWAALELKLKN